MMQKSYLLLIVFLVALLTGCAPDGLKEAPTPTSGGEFIQGEAYVEEIEIVLLESFPLQVHVIASGYLSDPCTEIDVISVEREGNHFEILITTLREADIMCIQLEETFERNIPLDVYGLPAGKYTVSVNGVEAGFTFLQDNSPPEG